MFFIYSRIYLTIKNGIVYVEIKRNNNVKIHIIGLAHDKKKRIVFTTIINIIKNIAMNTKKGKGV